MLKRVPTPRTSVSNSGWRAFTFSVRHAPDCVHSVQPKDIKMSTTRPANEAPPPPTPVPQDNAQRRQNLSWGDDATRRGRDALQRHMTVAQVPGRDRTS